MLVPRFTLIMFYLTIPPIRVPGNLPENKTRQVELGCSLASHGFIADRSISTHQTRAIGTTPLCRTNSPSLRLKMMLLLGRFYVEAKFRALKCRTGYAKGSCNKTRCLDDILPVTDCNGAFVAIRNVHYTCMAYICMFIKIRYCCCLVVWFMHPAKNCIMTAVRFLRCHVRFK